MVNLEEKKQLINTTFIKMLKKFALTFLVCLSSYTYSQQILNVREQAEVIDSILEDRLNNLLPHLMDETDIDMWVLISREYNEDPVLKTMLPANWLHARRRTILVFYRDKALNRIDKLAVARYAVGKSIQSAWDKEQQPDQWKRLIELIKERNPSKIALNYSKDFNICDGLDKTDYQEFMGNLPKKYKNRVISSQPLAVRWIETRTPSEMKLYPQLVEITHSIIEEAFSSKQITVGITTTSDLEWFLRQKVVDLGLDTWFHPTVDIQRSEEKLVSHLYSFSGRPDDEVIQPGDLLHCDFGITYLRLNTDIQELAYVLRPGEVSAPDYLVEALKKGNQLQDILTSNFKVGALGNDILKASLTQAKEKGLKPSIYTHPLGLYGHSSGTTIGMWDAQNGITTEDGTAYPMRSETVYSIELNTTVEIPQWKRTIRVMLEENGYFGKEGFRYINGRQKQLLLVGANSSHISN
jgi:Xaa-Pro aminopeptidase